MLTKADRDSILKTIRLRLAFSVIVILIFSSIFGAFIYGFATQPDPTPFQSGVGLTLIGVAAFGGMIFLLREFWKDD